MLMEGSWELVKSPGKGTSNLMPPPAKVRKRAQAPHFYPPGLARHGRVVLQERRPLRLLTHLVVLQTHLNEASGGSLGGS